MRRLREIRGTGGSAGIWLIGLVALVVRLAAVHAVGSYRLEHVSYEHGQIARNLVEGRGFTIRWMGAEGPTSQQAPVYPTLLACFYWIFGSETPMAHAAIQVFQCLVGAAMAMLAAALARELVPRLPNGAGLAGLGAASYPTLVYSTTQIQVASLATMLVVLVLWTAVRSARTCSVSLAICCGAGSGLLILTDPILALVAMIGLAVLAVWRDPQSSRIDATPRRYLHAVVSLGVTALVVTPWIVRNYRVHGELVFVKSTFGYAFWQGNHPSSFGTDKIPLPRSAADTAHDRWSIRALEQSLWRTRLVDTLYIDDAVLSNDRIAELGRLREPSRSRALGQEAIEFILAHPSHYARLCLQRFRYFLLFDETNPKSQVVAYRVSHLLLQSLALLGLWLARRHWRSLWPTYLAFVGLTMFHTLTIVSARFHIPLEPIQLLWAGAGLAELGRLVAGLPAELGRNEPSSGSNWSIYFEASP